MSISVVSKNKRAVTALVTAYKILLGPSWEYGSVEVFCSCQTTGQGALWLAVPFWNTLDVNNGLSLTSWGRGIQAHTLGCFLLSLLSQSGHFTV